MDKKQEFNKVWNYFIQDFKDKINTYPEEEKITADYVNQCLKNLVTNWEIPSTSYGKWLQKIEEEDNNKAATIKGILASMQLNYQLVNNENEIQTVFKWVIPFAIGGAVAYLMNLFLPGVSLGITGYLFLMMIVGGVMSIIQMKSKKKISDILASQLDNYHLQIAYLL